MSAVRKTLLFLFLLGIVNVPVLVDGQSNDNAAKDPPLNVILISLDTLRADHLGCYGYGRETSPAMDQFAEQSVVFRNSFANSNWTLPSHMSLMTSLQSAEHGVVDKKNRLSSRIPTLAEILKDQGYRTAAFTAGYFVDRKFGFDKGFDIYRQDYESRRRNRGQGWRLKNIEPDLFSWLDAHHQETFFLFVHSYDTHEPFIAHQYLSELAPGYRGPMMILRDMYRFKTSREYLRFKGEFGGDYLDINLFYKKVINEGLITLTAEDAEYVVALYDNEIRYVDDYVGRLLGKLGQLGLMDNTVIVIWSDHGEELLERGRIAHGAKMFDELLRVPLIMRIPGRPPAVVDTLAQGIDVAPTLLDVLDLPAERSFAGVALLQDGATNPHVIAEDGEEMCIRTDRHKLVVTRDLQSYTLYDLVADPHETKDVALDQPGVVADLRSRLFESLNIVDLDDELRRRLESLGYIE